MFFRYNINVNSNIDRRNWSDTKRGIHIKRLRYANVQNG